MELLNSEIAPFLLIAATFCMYVQASIPLGKRIVNGMTSPSTPFYAKVRYGRQFCAATLVDGKTALVSDSCLPDDDNFEDVRIQVADYTKTTNGNNVKEFQIAKVIRHPDLNSYMKRHVITVVKLEEKASGKGLLPMCTKKYRSGRVTMGMAGMGQTDSGKDANVLQEAFLAESYVACNGRMMSGYSDDYNVCVVNPNNRQFGALLKKFLKETLTKQLSSLKEQENSKLIRTSMVSYGDNGNPIYVMDEKQNPTCLYGMFYMGEECTGACAHRDPSQEYRVMQGERISFYKKWIEQQM
ncbi:uncharacterized protein LOC142342258 isoform X1 [Convolutriloba macropyga]|uniref:uncharacterized protein LOC142342258 isoform X1 n=1 Tax=Convolutriloba macropyga TaxID=536237 RepID=UPI003F520DAF